MAERFGSYRGGIAGLIDIIDNHGDALEADLIDRNLRLRNLGTTDFNWRDLLIIVRYLRADSHLISEMFPKRAKAAMWDLKAQLLAYLVDIGNLWVWMHTDDGRSDPPRNPPDPIGLEDGRPGVKPNSNRHKPKATPISEYKRQHGDMAADPNRAKRLSELFG